MYHHYNRPYSAPPPEDLPDLEHIVSHGGGKIGFPEEPSRRYAFTVGLSARAATEDAVRHCFGWLVEKAAPEWCQLLRHR